MSIESKIMLGLIVGVAIILLMKMCGVVGYNPQEFTTEVKEIVLDTVVEDTVSLDTLVIDSLVQDTLCADSVAFTVTQAVLDEYAVNDVDPGVLIPLGD